MRTKIWIEYVIDHTTDDELTDILADFTYEDNLPEHIEFSDIVREIPLNEDGTETEE